jgi:prepilin-type processing-associated H-X9-DG protein
MSNLKQQGLVLMMYVQDNDEGYPLAITSHTTDSTTPGGVWSTNYWYWQQSLMAYHKDFGIFYCPSSSVTANSSTNPSMASYNYYGANISIMPTSGTPLKLAALQSAASTYLLMDFGFYSVNPTYVKTPATTQYFYYLPGYGDAVGINGCTLKTSPADPDGGGAFHRSDCQSGRHFGGVNVAFADGHVKWIKSREVYNEAVKNKAVPEQPNAFDPADPE